MNASLRAWGAVDRLLNRLRKGREGLALLVDLGGVAVAWQATYLFRLGFDRWLSARPDYDPWVLAGLLGVWAVVFRVLRIPRALWRFSGFGEVKRLTVACVLAGVLTAAGVRALGLDAIPRAVLALHPVLALMGLVLLRIGYRMLYEHMRARLHRGAGEVRQLLILGAGEAASRLVAGLRDQDCLLHGLLDDEPTKRGRRVAGVPVLGGLDELPLWVDRLPLTHLVLAIPSLRGTARQRVLELAAATGLPVLTVPSLEELQEGVPPERVRDIKPEDLLGRAPVELDEAGIGELIRGQTVLVTGAGGSIGSELCRQVARYQPARLVLYELSEFNLYSLDQELQERFPNLALTRLMGDVKDYDHLLASLFEWQPSLVLHAAAFKHVPLMEEQANAVACLRNNTLGTFQAARAAAEAGVARFVLISTDKAVNPTNIMGATKRAAERVISALAQEHPRTRFMAVRFGNVLGSSGSVIPKFKAQIAKGGPVTVTHPNIIRYFMTIPEAARLVLQAAAIGDTGQVLVLDMGEPVKIVDLARDMIRLSGHSLEDIAIEFTGLRPGEKLFEELLADNDTTLATRCRSVRIARLGGVEPAEVRAWLRDLDLSPEAGVEAIAAQLGQFVPEYRRNAS
ncbi:polysaccharide biosynthesis protein [Inhella gelatinilytica]|uniref:Polysaccharide biosynthesis protein n=1 Tax=Inhella gelatinilytica TaxID=2795030 RepID=A0A931IUG9_9BURK|nr:nucleoside-diphosphate sugar epimerase/dehydratase [Inhella gelatinilytica]MBH9551219.1 polysaccharide biosynthesis protein [Inhella gelatinilytica]